MFWRCTQVIQKCPREPPEDPSGPSFSCSKTSFRAGNVSIPANQHFCTQGTQKCSKKAPGSSTWRLWGPSWKHLCANLAPIWPNWSPTRPQLDLILAHFGPNLPHLGANLPLQEPFWHPSGPKMPPGLPQGPHFERFWLIWGAILKVSGGLRGWFGDTVGSKSSA